MSRIRHWLEDAAFTVCVVALALLMTALYWSCRIFGIDLNDDF